MRKGLEIGTHCRLSYNHSLCSNKSTNTHTDTYSIKIELKLSVPVKIFFRGVGVVKSTKIEITLKLEKFNYTIHVPRVSRQTDTLCTERIDRNIVAKMLYRWATLRVFCRYFRDFNDPFLPSSKVVFSALTTCVLDLSVKLSMLREDLTHQPHSCIILKKNVSSTQLICSHGYEALCAFFE